MAHLRNIWAMDYLLFENKMQRKKRGHAATRQFGNVNEG